MSTIDSRVVYYLGLLFGIPHTVGFGDCVLNGIVRTIDFGDCALNGIARTIDFGDCLRRSHAGHFFCVFSLIIWTFFFFVVFLSRSYTNSSIFILAEGNTPYGKRHNSRTESLFWLQSTRYLRRKLAFTAILSILLTASLWRILHPEQRPIIDESYNKYSANLKNVRVLARRKLFDIELRRQCQPFVLPPVQASNGAPRFVKH